MPECTVFPPWPLPQTITFWSPTGRYIVKFSDGSMGARGTCAPTSQSNFINFHAVFGKNYANNRLLQPFGFSDWEILDLPLIFTGLPWVLSRETKWQIFTNVSRNYVYSPNKISPVLQKFSCQTNSQVFHTQLTKTKLRDLTVANP